MKIHYPFHAFYGRELATATHPRHGETRSFYTCHLADGTWGRIPRWVCQAEAEGMGTLVDRPQCSVESLEELGGFVQRLLARGDCQNPPEVQKPGGKNETKNTGVRGRARPSLARASPTDSKPDPDLVGQLIQQAWRKRKEAEDERKDHR